MTPARLLRLSLLAAVLMLGAACSAVRGAISGGGDTHEAAPSLAASPPGLVATQPAHPPVEQPSRPAAGLVTDLPAPQTTAIPASPQPSPSPPPPVRQLTQGGCCSGAFWSPDSRAALFLDRPDPNQPAGIWQAPVGGGEPSLFTNRLGVYSNDMQLRAFPERGETIVERMADGQRWVIPNGGRVVSFSPGATRLAWTTGQTSNVLQNAAQRTVWISRVDGSEARQLITVTGGGFSGWLTDDSVLISSRPAGSSNVQALARLDLAADGTPDGEPVELARTERLRNFVIAPGGRWAVYLTSFTADAAEDGLWLLDTAGGQRRKLEVFGAYRWRDAERLLIIPLEPGAAAQRVLQIDAATGASTTLIDGSIAEFKIANGEWSISPDGGAILFRSAQDQNLWVLSLP